MYQQHSFCLYEVGHQAGSEGVLEMYAVEAEVLIC